MTVLYLAGNSNSSRKLRSKNVERGTRYARSTDCTFVRPFTSPCKEPAKWKGEHQSYFILEKNIYNSFTSTTNKLMVPCTYATTNNRHSLVTETTKSSAVFSVAGELFIGTNLVQIVCSEIEWSYPVARKENQINSQNPQRGKTCCNSSNKSWTKEREKT